MTYLLDTNVLSELRKGERCHPGVARWFDGVRDEQIFLSVLTLGEIRKGIEKIRRRDRLAAQSLETWLADVEVAYLDRILPVDPPVAQAWGRLNAGDPLPVVDSLIAATALVHGLEVVTRNTKDLERCGAPFFDPFTDG